MSNSGSLEMGETTLSEAQFDITAHTLRICRFDFTLLEAYQQFPN